MSAGPNPGYIGAVVVAPDSGGAPGSFVALAGAMKYSLGRKGTQQDFSPLNRRGAHSRAGSVVDFDLSIEATYDVADAGQVVLIAAPLAGARVWVRLFESATKYEQFSFNVSEITISDDDVNGLTKASYKLEFDGTPTSPYTSGTGAVPPAPGITAPIAAYKSKLYLPGTSTAITAEACAHLSGQIYQVTNSAKRVLDPAVVPVVKDGGVAVAATDLASIDMLRGKITFAAGYVVGGAITLDANYIPINALANVFKVTTTLTFEQLPSTDTNNSSGYAKRTYGPRDVKTAFEVHDLASSTPVATNTWSGIVTGRIPVIVQHDPDGAGTQTIRAWENLESDNASVDFGSLVNQAFSGVGASQSNGSLYAADISVGAA